MSPLSADPERFAEMTDNFERKAFRLKGKDIHWPITTVISDLNVSKFADSRFVLDLGKDPQIGQIWELNKTISIPPYSITIDSIQLTESYHGAVSLHFFITSNCDIVGMSINAMEN